MSKLRIPNGWAPRPYQEPLWTYLATGGRRADVAAHRRWGKDEVALHWAAFCAVQTPGLYWHMLPEAGQARRAICAGPTNALLDAPRSFQIPETASLPCRLPTLPPAPTMADLELGYVERGSALLQCDLARQLAVDTLQDLAVARSSISGN